MKIMIWRENGEINLIFFRIDDSWCSDGCFWSVIRIFSPWNSMSIITWRLAFYMKGPVFESRFEIRYDCPDLRIKSFTLCRWRGLWCPRWKFAFLFFFSSPTGFPVRRARISVFLCDFPRSSTHGKNVLEAARDPPLANLKRNTSS